MAVVALGNAAYTAPVRVNCGQPLLHSGATSRRALLRRALLAGGATIALTPPPATAADEQKLIWLSGKSDPIRKTSKEKPDGTKKDGKYLGCLNDCVPRRQGPPGPGQRERADCLEDCQRECCFTYEQCTYTIKKF